jgi:Thiopurine S-methyltransferase (TPMT)
MWRRGASICYKVRRCKFSTGATSQLNYWTNLWRTPGADVFTEEDVNENLIKYMHDFIPSVKSKKDFFGTKSFVAENDETVFVPLCGASPDVQYLASSGFNVVGLDAIDVPLRRLANECGGLIPDSEDRIYRLKNYPNCILIHGDIFSIPPKRYGVTFDGIFDRGGITSIEPALQLKYLQILSELLKPEGNILLEFLSVSSSGQSSPGSLSLERLIELSRAASFQTSILHQRNVTDQYPDSNFGELEEIVLLLKK